MSGEKNLANMIQRMRPRLNPGRYVFCSVQDLKRVPREDSIAEFKEKEGISIVIAQEKADALGLNYEFIASWISLELHSSLEAVGLTAFFSNELAQHQISANVVAGYYHDHIFVPEGEGLRAIKLLEESAQRYNPSEKSKK